jgi:hypothetical protein
VRAGAIESSSRFLRQHPQVAYSHVEERVSVSAKHPLSQQASVDGIKMKLKYRAAAIAAATLVLVGMASTAQADSFSSAFNVNAGAAQAPAATTYQSKSTNASGVISFSAIGSSYKMDVQMCQFLVQCSRGTKVYGLNDNNVVTALPNSYPIGTKSITSALQTSTWAAVQVQAQGRWQAW